MEGKTCDENGQTVVPTDAVIRSLISAQLQAIWGLNQNAAARDVHNTFEIDSKPEKEARFASPHRLTISY